MNLLEPKVSTNRRGTKRSEVEERGFPRGKIFLWRCSWGILPTFDNFVQRRVASSSLCFRCHVNTETVFHAIRECVNSQQAWSQLALRAKWRVFKFSNFVELCNAVWTYCSSGQACLFAIMCWTLWNDRNHLLHESSSSPPNVLVQRAVEYVFFAKRKEITNESPYYNQNLTGHGKEQGKPQRAVSETRSFHHQTHTQYLLTHRQHCLPP